MQNSAVPPTHGVQTALGLSEESLRRLERLYALGALTAQIVHDLNNPLNSIAMNAELGTVLVRQSAQADIDGEKLARLFQTIVGGVGRSGQIVQDVLAFARAQRFTAEGMIDAVTLITQACDWMRILLHRKNVELDLRLQEMPALVPIHGPALQQAVIQLLQNCIDAEAKKIQISAESQHKQILLRIVDDGDGIDDSYVGQIFEPFFTTRGAQEKLGLGLSLVQHIVADHQGRVEVNSSVTDGTCFTLYLPL